MDSGSGLPAFDELPLVYQARIRDIQQEFMDGDITQKGYDKRMAKIVEDYQSTAGVATANVVAGREAASAPEKPRSVHRAFTGGDNEGVSCAFSAIRVGSDGPSSPSPPPPPPLQASEGELLSPTAGTHTRPAVGSRSSGSCGGGVVDTRAFYEARKSTVVGFRKPGINFDALLDDFEDDDDEDGGLGLQALTKISHTGGARSNGLSQFGLGGGAPPQAAPPIPELPGVGGRAAYPIAPCIDVERAAYDDDELTSGRAYNVLSDIMDPYGSQMSRANQELYSDDSSNDGILDDLDGLSPAGINSTSISPGHTKPSGPLIVSEERDVLAEPTGMRLNGGPAGEGGEADLRLQISRQADDLSLAGNGMMATNGMVPVGGHRPDIRLPVLGANSSSGMYGTPSSVNMLTPDTPTVGQFGASNFGSGSTFTDTIRTPNQPGRARYAENMASLSPVSGIHSTAADDEQASSDVGAADSQERVSGRQSIHSSTTTTDHAATIASGVGTITLEDMAAAAAAGGSSRNDYVECVGPDVLSSNRPGLPDAWAAPPAPPSHAEYTEEPVDTRFNDDSPGGDFSQHSLGSQHHQRPSIQSAAFGSFEEHNTVQQQSAMHSQASISNTSNRTAGRRPTYSTRSDRGGGAGAVGRASYYAPEAQPEVPANFDMHLLPNIDPAMVMALESAEASSSRGDSIAQAAATGTEYDNRDSLEDYAFEQALPYHNSMEHNSEVGAGAGAIPVIEARIPTMDYEYMTSSIGAIVYPREIPDEVYSSKLRAVQEGHENLASVLRFRATATPNLIAYTCIDTKGKEIGSWTWAGLHTRAVQVAQVVRQRGVTGWGDRVALVYRKYEVLDFVGSLFGCFYAGLCAVPIVAGDSYAELVHVLQSTGSALVLTTELNIKALHKDMSQNNVGAGWPTDVAWVRTDNLGGIVLSGVGALSASSQFHARAAEPLGSSHIELQIDQIGRDDLAYIEFSKSPNGELKGVQVTHGAIMRQCAVWMMSTGMLDIGRKYKHRVELDEQEHDPDYAQGLDDGDQISDQISEQLDSAEAAAAAVEPEPEPVMGSSVSRKWGSTSGFLGRLRNVGSLPKMRRGSRGRDASIGSARSSVVGPQPPPSAGRVRAASNLSSLIPPATAPQSNTPVFQDVVASYIEPRQHFGLVFGVFGACYGGHQSVYASSVVCELPGAYINLLTRYRATVAVGDYAGLQAVLATATDEPAQITGFSKKVAPNLACLRLCLVDTLFIDPGFHAAFDRNVLHRFGCAYQSIADTEGHPVVTPVCTLAEHGSVLMAMRDCLGSGAAPHEFVLDRSEFRANRVAVLPDERGEAEVDRVGTVRFPSFGFPALSATVAVVDPETRELCATDAIGELWISSPSLGSGFWGLPKLSASIFTARFMQGDALSAAAYLRTGLMGAVVQGRVLVFGFYEDRIRTLTLDRDAIHPSLSFHYAGDINSSIRRYLPQVSECTAFEMFANDTHFPVIAAEVRHNSGAYATVAEEIYSVLRSRHGLHAYAVALCPPNTLPRAFQYGKRTVNAQLCRHQFESGRVNCLYVRLSTDRLFVNLPPPANNCDDDNGNGDDRHHLLDPSVARYGRWLQQTSLEAPAPSIDEPSGADLRAFACITDLLVWRAAKYPDHVAFTQFDKTGRPLKPMTFAKLLLKVSAVAQLMLDKRRVSPGDHVLVAIAPSPSLAVAIHACLAIGAVPIAIAPPDVERLSDDLPPLLVTAREFHVNFILVDPLSEEIFKGKMMDAAMRVQSLRSLLGSHRMPAPLSVAKAPKSPRHLLGQHPSFRVNPQWASDPARTALVMQFTGAQASTPQYVSYSHRAILGFCSQQKGDFQMLPTLPVIASVRAYNGYGLLHCVMIGVYVGCMTLMLSPVDFFASPPVWFDLVQRYNIKDAFTTLPMLQHAMNFLSAYPTQYRFKLSAVRNFIVATEERVDPLTYANIRDFFAQYGLSDTAINPLYGTLMNPCISTRAYLGVSPLTLRLDIHAMRRAKVVALSPLFDQLQQAADGNDINELHSLTLQDSGKVSGSTMVAIVDPATHLPLPAGCIGEVWVCSDSNATRKQTPVALPAGASSQLPRRLMTITDSTGCLDVSQDNSNDANVFVRTGDLGFLYLQVTTAATQNDDDNDDSAPAEPYLFVAGRIAETFHLDGYMHFYSDLERSVEEPCEDIVQGSCVVIQTTLNAPGANPADTATPIAAVDPSAPPRLVAVISLRRAPSDSFLPNAACLIFNNVLDRHQVLLDEIVFVPRDALPRSRISERRRRTVRGLYESGKLNAFVSYPIANYPAASCAQ